MAVEITVEMVLRSHAFFLEGHAVTVVYAGNKEHCSESNRVQQDILNAYGISIYMDIPERSDLLL